MVFSLKISININVTHCILTQVLCRYKEEGFDFLLKAFNSPNYLEDLTGLSQLYAQTFDDQVSMFD